MTYLTPNRSIPATGGTMDTFVALPETKPLGTVLIAVELWGMTTHMQDIAERLAAQGYAAVVLDLFRRQAPPVPEDPIARWSATFEAFDDVRCTRDCRMALDWTRSGACGFDAGSVFAWGFCMGGRFAHNLAAFDQRLAGAINFYGRINFPRMPDKPFLPIEVTRMIDAPYLGLFAETDGLIPEEDVQRLRQDLRANPNAEVRVMPGTQHAFFNDQRAAYHPAAAQEAWTKVLTFLERHR
jgi:carboxymethylenebutenolidase